MITILLLFTLLICINLIQLRFAQPGSDHYVHFGYINSIKRNNHKFITRVNTFINDEDFPDPQLYHWLLALLPLSVLERNYRYMGLVFNILSLAFFVLFLDRLFPFLRVNVDYHSYLFIAGIVYIITPFEYFTWNAKNVGLSARGFGLMFGHLFVYAITLYAVSGAYGYLLLAIGLAYIILLSSQFAFQFVFFFCIIFSFLAGDLLLTIIPFLAVILFLITFPKWSIVFFRRQWEYKKMYYTVLSWRFGLKARYSIWRDFIYDFWKALRQMSLVRAFEYIYRNPIIEISIGFPALVLFVLLCTFHSGYFMSANPSVVLLYKVIVAALLIFLLTSFRTTRFLGEPQRYVEFVFPIISILPVAIPSWGIGAIIVWSLAIIAFEVVGIRFLAKRDGGGSTTHDKTLQVLDYFKHLDLRSENKIASNNADLLKFFADKDYRILNVNVTTPYTGDLHFNDIFPNIYGDMDLHALLHLSRRFQINWLVLDQKLVGKDKFLQAAGSDFKETATIHHFTIFKMC